MMQNPARRAPHQGNVQPFSHHAPNAALLIDFDNVTMGIRSDLGKEMKALLNSEVIRGKVAVQRAYADWRRYPQYIVPLAESSIDLIFAPAYGSSKKNATDLRMAIDAIELVFTRPEIGTYILMTGDSDFSSCVLKLKEYGKYVIGVGMRESSSDLLVQNCDEYYSYHALSGLTRTDEVVESKEDPWALLKRAAQQMAARGDVMRTDRLKQVMLEIDPAFDEKAVGYSKFSRFVQEASSKGLLKVRKGENGQYEIVVDGEAGDGAAKAAAPAERGRREEGDGRRRRGGRGRDRDREERKPAETEAAARKPEPIEEPVAEPAAKPAEEAAPTEAAPTEAAPTEAATTEAAPAETAAAGPVRDLDQAYGLLQLAVREITGDNGGSIRDGDVKRKMMELSPGFDEGQLGFSKFTRFLRQAHDAEAIDLTRANGGNYEVSLPSSGKRFKAPAVSATPAAAPSSRQETGEKPSGRKAAAAEKGTREKPEAKAKPAAERKPTEEPKAAEERKPETAEPKAEAAATSTARAPRAGVGSLSRRGGRPGMAEGPPPILPGQAVGVKKPEAEVEPKAAGKASEKAAEKAPAAKKTTRTRKPAAKKATVETAPAAEKPAKKKTSEKPAKKPATRGRKPAKAPAAPSFSAEALGLPRDRDSIVAYLTNSYKGIGQKTADTLMSEFGEDVFRVMNEDPDRVRSAVGARSKGLLEQWNADFTRRSEEQTPAKPAAPAPKAKAAEADEKPKSRSRRGTRGGRGRKKKEPASS